MVSGSLGSGDRGTPRWAVLAAVAADSAFLRWLGGKLSICCAEMRITPTTHASRMSIIRPRICDHRRVKIWISAFLHCPNGHAIIPIAHMQTLSIMLGLDAHTYNRNPIMERYTFLSNGLSFFRSRGGHVLALESWCLCNFPWQISSGGLCGIFP